MHLPFSLYPCVWSMWCIQRPFLFVRLVSFLLLFLKFDFIAHIDLPLHSMPITIQNLDLFFICLQIKISNNMYIIIKQISTCWIKENCLDAKMSNNTHTKKKMHLIDWISTFKSTAKLKEILFFNQSLLIVCVHCYNMLMLMLMLDVVTGLLYCNGWSDIICVDFSPLKPIHFLIYLQIAHHNWIAGHEG